MKLSSFDETTVLIIGIDPGCDKTAVVELNCDDMTIADAFWRDNEDVLQYLENAGEREGVELAIENIQSYGMPVGMDVLRTCRWIGRFEDRWSVTAGKDAHLLCRKSSFGVFPGIGPHLCHTNRANDSAIRQAVIDRFPRVGGGTTPQIGNKSSPGPLYCVKHSGKDASKHTWQALAVAVVANDTLQQLATL